MLRSLFSGVSGLRTHQTKMDVIGNNIANVNTTAFKSGRVTFKDIYYQTVSNAAANTGVKGGSNPRQIGYGSTVSSIDVMHTRGGFQSTDRALDLYLAGDGYFVMKNGAGATSYTRVGNFSFDVQGGLVDANGNYVSGWQPYSTGNGINASPLVISNISDYTNVSIGSDGLVTGVYSGPESAHKPNTYEEVGALSGITVAGYSNIRFENGTIKGDDIAAGTSGVELYGNVKIHADGTITGDDVINGVSSSVIGHMTDFVTEPADYSSYLILSDGKIAGLFKGHFTNKTEQLGSINGPSLTLPGYSQMSFANGSLTGIDDSTGLSTTIYTNIKLDVSGRLVGDNAVSGAIGETIPGITIGNQVVNSSLYTSLTLDADGNITGQYIGGQYPEHITGEIEVLGQIAVAKFGNPEGLFQQDGVYFQETQNSGQPVISYPGDHATATIVSGGLEMSNVDLSKEFTDMITTQRGFQANSRIITTSDEMLQELVNLKR